MINKEEKLLNVSLKIFWIGSILGFIMPIVTLVLKVSVNNFKGWDLLLDSSTMVSDLVINYPVINIKENFPFLSKLGWHKPFSYYCLPRYVRYSLFNLLAMGLMLRYSNVLKIKLKPFIQWVLETPYAFQRKLIFGICIFFLLTFQLKLYWGFWYAGISGWSNNDVQSLITNTYTPDTTTIKGRNIGEIIPDFLIKGINPSNVQYVSRAGYIQKNVMFLHFKDGQVLPINYELTEFVFPRFIFGKKFNQEIRDTALFLKVIKHSLKKRRRNRRFLLPQGIGYPNHTPYMRIDYTQYPSENSIVNVSFWEILAKISGSNLINTTSQNQIKIIDAKNTFLLNNPNEIRNY